MVKGKPSPKAKTKGTAQFQKLYNALKSGACSGKPRYKLGSSPKVANQPCGEPPDQKIEIIWTRTRVPQNAPLKATQVLARCCYSGKAYRRFVQRYGATFKLQPAHTYAQIKGFAQSAEARGTKLASELQQRLNRLDERMRKQTVSHSAVHTELQSLMSRIVNTKGFSAALDGVFAPLPKPLFGAKELGGVKLKKQTAALQLRSRLSKVKWPDRYSNSYAPFMGQLKQIFADLGLKDETKEQGVHNRCEQGGERALDLHQKFPYYYLADVTPYRGLLAFWSVGSGKTAAAWALLAMYKDLPEWNLVWVTKSSLKGDLFKDKWAYGDALASDESIKRRVSVISYKTFNNALTNNNELGRSWRARAKKNGYANFLAKTVIIIDEAHLLYDVDVTLVPQERPDPAAIEGAYFSAYDQLPVAQQPKTLLLSATPIVDQASTLLRLQNLLINRADWRFPVSTEAFEKKFKVGADGRMSQSGLDQYKEQTKGLIDCYDGRLDKSRFAQPLLIAPHIAQGSVEQLDKLKKSEACKEGVRSGKRAKCFLHVANYIGPHSPQYLSPASINILKNEFSRAGAKTAYFAGKAAKQVKAKKPKSDCSANPCAEDCSFAQVKAYVKSKGLKVKGISGFKAQDKAKLCAAIGLDAPLKLASPQKLDRQFFIAPKIPLLYSTILQLDADDAKNEGQLYKHLIFSSTKQGGIGAAEIASALASQDFDEVKVRKQGDTLSLVFKGQTLAELKRGQREPTYFEVAEKPRNGFVLMTLSGLKDQFGSLRDGDRDALKKLVFRSINRRPDNTHGQLIRFIILDAAFKEGVDVFDVKYIHLFEPQLTEADEVQAVGRGVRRCGQSGLAFGKDGWKVQVHQYETEVDGYRIEQEARKLMLGPKESALIEQLTAALYAYAVSNVVYSCRRFQLAVPPPLSAAQVPLEPAYSASKSMGSSSEEEFYRILNQLESVSPKRAGAILNAALASLEDSVEALSSTSTA